MNVSFYLGSRKVAKVVLSTVQGLEDDGHCWDEFANAGGQMTEFISGFKRDPEDKTYLMLELNIQFEKVWAAYGHPPSYFCAQWLEFLLMFQ